MELGPEIKAAVVAAALVALWLGETWRPFYTQFPAGRSERWRHDAKNLGLGLLNTGMLWLLFAAAFSASSTFAEAHRIGLLRWVDWPWAVESIVALVLFDSWMYVWHRANHTLGFLWRFHRMHHTDPEMDASTGVRFHPGEALLSSSARLLVLPLLGMTPWQLLLYETVLLPVVLLHHSNVSLPRWLDYGLLAVIVTPAMHRVHHSRRCVETHSNYASVFSGWDRLLRSFRLRDDAHTISLGLQEMDDPRWRTLGGMLATPLAAVARPNSGSAQ